MEKKETKSVLSHEEKLELMLEYMEKTGERIKATTKYKGYNLGTIRNNLRNSYFSGTLKMEKNLLKRFIEAGIIKEKKERKDRTTQEDKYKFVMQSVEESPEQMKDKKMDTGLSFSEVKKSLQLAYNKGTLKLTPEQIENLIKAGILNYTKEKQESIAAQCGIPAKFAIDIIKKYGSFETFLEGYKKGEIEYNFNGEIFCGYRGIALSAQDRTEREKTAYCMLAEEIVEISIGTEKPYIDMDKLQELLSVLDENEKKVIIFYYGLEENKKNAVECGKELNLTPARIGQIRAKAIRKLRSPQRIGTFYSDAQKEEEQIQKYRRKLEEIQAGISDWKKIKEFIIDENGIPREGIEDVTLSEIGVSESTFMDGRTENRRIGDLMNLEAIDETIGPRNMVALLSICNHKLYDYLVEQKSVKEQIQILENRLSRYKVGEENYRQIEEIFNPDAIVPAVPGSQGQLGLNGQEDSQRKQTLLRSIEKKQKELAGLKARLLEMKLGDETQAKE